MNEIDKQIQDKMSEIASLYLWKLGAIKINLKNPFKLVSGNFSPIYINCRLLISSSNFVHFFVSYVDLIIKSDELKVNLLAGGESAGIPFAAFAANALNLPMVYVRKKVKEHGLGSLIEGEIKKGDQVLLIEDLITDAGSKLNFIEAIKNEGANVKNIIVVFDREQGGKGKLKEMNIKLFSLTQLKKCIDIAYENNFLSKDNVIKINEYLKSPKIWHEKKGLPFN